MSMGLVAPEGWFLMSAMHMHKDDGAFEAPYDFSPKGNPQGDFTVSFAKYPGGNYVRRAYGHTLEDAWKNAAAMCGEFDACFTR